MSIRLNTRYSSIKNPSLSSSIHLHYGSKENVGFKCLFNFFHKAFPLAFNRETFQRVYDASDISKIAYRTKYCCQFKIYGAILATSIFDFNQKRQLKILMLVEDNYSIHAINIGKRLLLQIIDTCKELENILQIYAYVESTNIDGIKFYKMMGFQEREILQDYFSQRASLTPNAIKLEYRIGTSRISNNSDTLLSPNSTIYNVCLSYPRIFRSFKIKLISFIFSKNHHLNLVHHQISAK
jgi:GNAT superfamily N-acetyltransferase